MMRYVISLGQDEAPVIHCRSALRKIGIITLAKKCMDLYIFQKY